MKISVFSKSITGYKNEIKNKGSQDYIFYEISNNGVICAVADGHSGDYFIFSSDGSQFACEALIEVMGKYIKEESDYKLIKNLLENKKIQYEICSKWKQQVTSHYNKKLPCVYKTDYYRYGTTLLGMIVSNDYKLYLKLGDGDILINKDNVFTKIFPYKYTRLVNTLSERDAYNKFQYKIEKKNDNECFSAVMYSDGYDNSFSNFQSMSKDLEKTMRQYNKNIFTRFVLEKNYEKYLNKLSEEGSKDDISIVFVNIL